MRSHRSWRMFVLLASLMMFGCRGTPPPHAPLTQGPTKAQARAWLLSGNYQALDAAFSAIQAEYRTGARSDESLHIAFLALYDADAELRPAYDGWVRAYPRSYVALLARGIYHRKVGQDRRGGAFSSETSDSQFQGMQAEYALAMQDFTASKQLDARPLLTLSNELDILANFSDAGRMRALLDESRKIDPANVVVRRLYLTYLEPRWGGSEQQMQDFVEEARTEGLPAPKVRSLEGAIIADHAHTAESAGDDATAEREYRQALEMGDEGCAACFGMVLLREQKFLDAIPLLTRAITADPGDSESLYWRGVAYLGVGSSKEGFTDLLEAAQLGYPDAQNRIGILYLTGLADVTVQNTDLGEKWLRECAAKGNQDCTRNLQLALQFYSIRK